MYPNELVGSQNVPMERCLQLQGLRVCYLGHYDREYARNRILIRAIRRTGAEVVEINNTHRSVRRASALLSAVLRGRCDIIFVGFPGHTDVPVGWLASRLRQVPLVFDAFISTYDSNVFDRQSVPPKSLRAKFYFLLDKFSCRMADVVLLDTRTHIDYFTRTFDLTTGKFRRMWIGAEDEIFFPRLAVEPGSSFTVVFHGSFVPLQGAEFIVQAAAVLESLGEDVQFIMVGSGQTLARTRELADRLKVRTVRFVGRVAYEQVPQLLAAADVCLGIFGITPKAARVIPNKVYEALAMSKPVITGDSPAAREALVHGQSAWLCPVGDGKSLAEAILTLRQDTRLRQMIAEGGYREFKRRFSVDAIAKEMEGIMLEVVK